MRLYSGPMSMFGAKAQIAVAEKGLSTELVMVPFGLRRRYDPKHPDVARINPKAQVPVLQDQGLELYDSTQIFEYLEDVYPDPPLWPVEAAERAQARGLEHASDEVFFPHVVKLMMASSGPDDPVHLAARSGIETYYRQMDLRLHAQAYLAGAGYSYADIAFFMAQMFAAALGGGMGDETPRLLDWRRRVAGRPAVADVAGPMARYMAERGFPPLDFLNPVSQVAAGG